MGYFFTDAPTVALIRTGDSVEQTIFLLTQLIISIAPHGRIVVLDGATRRRITETLNGCREVCQAVANRSPSGEVRQRFQALSDGCTKLAESYFSAPISAEELGPPDQALGRSDEPQP